MKSRSLELVRQDTVESLALAARVPLRQLTTFTWILLVACAIALTALLSLGVTSGAGVGFLWGIMLFQILSATWLKSLSVTARVSDRTIVIETWSKKMLRSAQSIDRVSGGRFELRPPPEVLGMQVHSFGGLYFAGHRVRLPFIFKTRSKLLCHEWNVLLDATERESASA